MKYVMPCLLACLWACQPTTEKVDASAAPPAAEIADPAYIQKVRTIAQALCEGNTAPFADLYTKNALFIFNYGDTLKGRDAIREFWKRNRGTTIDTMYFKNPVWLAIKANEPPPHVQAGVYVFFWADLHHYLPHRQHRADECAQRVWFRCSRQPALYLPVCRPIVDYEGVESIVEH